MNSESEYKQQPSKIKYLKKTWGKKGYPVVVNLNFLFFKLVLDNENTIRVGVADFVRHRKGLTTTWKIILIIFFCLGEK